MTDSQLQAAPNAEFRTPPTRIEPIAADTSEQRREPTAQEPQRLNAIPNEPAVLPMPQEPEEFGDDPADQAGREFLRRALARRQPRLVAENILRLATRQAPGADHSELAQMQIIYTNYYNNRKESYLLPEHAPSPEALERATRVLIGVSHALTPKIGSSLNSDLCENIIEALGEVHDFGPVNQPPLQEPASPLAIISRAADLLRQDFITKGENQPISHAREADILNSVSTNALNLRFALENIREQLAAMREYESMPG